MPRRRFMLVLLVLLAAFAARPSGAGTCRLRLATTTSTENSGLLDVLIPPFERQTGCRVDVIAVGTGKALRLGRSGDVDVVMVHAPKAEKAFVGEGYGVDRTRIMHNDFVVVGPARDPAGVRAAGSAAEALKRIATARAVFVSRGDDSGTHKKERALWRAAGMDPGGAWYREAGQGMGAVLRMADELRAYTLADRGTYLAMKDKLDLVILYAGDPALMNPYHVIAVNPKRHPHVKYDLARRFIAYLTGPEAQKIIADYRVGGEPLFVPDAALRP